MSKSKRVPAAASLRGGPSPVRVIEVYVVLQDGWRALERTCVLQKEVIVMPSGGEFMNLQSGRYESET